MFEVYARNVNDNIIILHGDRHSLRCRQRGENKVEPMRFVSHKQAFKKNKNVIGPFTFYSVSKL